MYWLHASAIPSSIMFSNSKLFKRSRRASLCALSTMWILDVSSRTYILMHYLLSVINQNRFLIHSSFDHSYASQLGYYLSDLVNLEGWLRFLAFPTMCLLRNWKRLFVTGHQLSVSSSLSASSSYRWILPISGWWLRSLCLPLQASDSSLRCCGLCTLT